ncbi:MAG: MATE family efflux transporter [Lachnospiraceae bacterium]|nr:MATE family efflux transporter [Lachnospiraceae bacterium]
MEKKQFYKMVAALVLPIAIQNLINVGVTSADVIMLGKVGETVLSASSLAGQIYFIMTLIFFGLTSGAAVLTAQYWGKGDTRTIEKVLGITLRIGFLVSIGFTLAVWAVPETLMRLFTSEEEVIAQGIQYLKIISCSYVFSGITIVYFNVMRSVERVVIATVTYSISLVINVVCNAIFIFGLLGAPVMGIRGAALGTLIARIFEVCVVVVYGWRYNDAVRFHWKDLFARNPVLHKDFLKYSMPVMFNELAWGAGMAAITAIVGHLGSAAVAAHSVTQVSRQLAMVVSMGVAAAAAIVCGKAIGEGREDLAKIYAARFTKLAAGLGVVGGTLILFISPVARALLNLSDQARSYLGFMMLVMAVLTLFQSMNCVWIVGVFRSGGDTKYGLYLDGFSLWGGSIILGILCAFVLHVPMPWLYVVLCCDELLKLPFAIRRYKSYRWLRNVTRASVSD